MAFLSYFSMGKKSYFNREIPYIRGKIKEAFLYGYREKTKNTVKKRMVSGFSSCVFITFILQ